MKSLSSELLQSHRIETVIKLINKNEVWEREKYKMKKRIKYTTARFISSHFKLINTICTDLKQLLPPV